MNSSDETYMGYLSFLYDSAAKMRIDENDIDDVVSESILAYAIYEKSGKAVNDPRALLYTILKNKHNDLLREKYKNKTVAVDGESLDIPFVDESEEKERLEEEYERVRMQISRLIGIYRDVVVRRYVHGQSVEKIAAELGIPKGTVLSRLSSGRAQIKDGLSKMEKYSKNSFEPKKTTIGIYGGDGLRGEPFSLLSSLTEGNILSLAYDKPVPVQALSDALGMPAAYVEPIVEKLVYGELMGKTPSGLVYTRCFVVNHKDSFGNVAAQEDVADKYAVRVWNIIYENIKPLTETGTFLSFTEKQKATMLLYVSRGILDRIVLKYIHEKVKRPDPPSRPDAGNWLATVTVFEPGEKRSKYDASGPVQVNYREPGTDRNLCQLFDYQSVFGDTHWAYGGFKYKCSLSSILRFYASFLPSGIQPDNALLYELVPEFEKLRILRRDDDGEIRLDIPALTYDETPAWNDAENKATEKLCGVLSDDLRKLVKEHKNKIPSYVDCAGYYTHRGALSAYTTAQLLSIVDKGLLPYKIEVGKTPLIYLAYRKA